MVDSIKCCIVCMVYMMFNSFGLLFKGDVLTFGAPPNFDTRISIAMLTLGVVLLFTSLLGIIVAVVLIVVLTRRDRNSSSREPIKGRHDLYPAQQYQQRDNTLTSEENI